MFKKILVCADGSACSLEAARLGAAVAQHFGAEVLAVNVFHAAYADPAYMGVWAMAIDPETIDSYAREQKEAIEQKVRPFFARLNLTCPFKQEMGHPVDCILRVAEEEKVDLIVIGSRGLRGVKELFLGSVSSGVLHHAACSVLIVREENALCEPEEIKQILLASDGSECARNAASVAVNMAQKFAASLTVLNVSVYISSISVPADDYALIRDENADLYSRQTLERIKQDVGSLVKDTDISCSYLQEVGYPDATIVRLAEEHKASLIVLGSRGLGGFARMLLGRIWLPIFCKIPSALSRSDWIYRKSGTLSLGSVSNYVTHHANCPVLVVR